MMAKRGLDLSGWGQGEAASCCEHCNELLGYINSGKFLENWGTRSFPKKGIAWRSLLVLCSVENSNTAGWAVPWLRRLAAGLPPRRPGFDPGSVHVGFVVDKVTLGQVSPRVLRFSPVNFIPPVLHYYEKVKNNHLHLHHRVAQEASWLRCVRSVCCGALQHKKKTVGLIFVLFLVRIRVFFVSVRRMV
jgi:hypothetical protein